MVNADLAFISLFYLPKKSPGKRGYHHISKLSKPIIKLIIALEYGKIGFFIHLKESSGKISHTARSSMLVPRKRP